MNLDNLILKTLIQKTLERIGKINPENLTSDDELICELMLAIKDLYDFKMTVYEKFASQIEILDDEDKRKPNLN